MLTETSDTPLLLSKFNLPEQDLSKLSFCASESAKLAEWLESLPATRITETSIIFYKTLPEICRLKAPPGKRVSMLETVHYHVHRCIEGSMHELLRQPLILSSQMMKLAVVTQALQRHLNDGYMVALKDLLHTKKGTARQPLLALCLSRAISGLSLLLLRSYQLYTPQSPTVWRKLHVLYRLAIEQQLEQTPIKDSLLKNQCAMTIDAAYKRSLLLACSSPYQLRQVDMMHLFHAFEEGSSMVRLKIAAEDNRQSLYWLSLKLDRGPFYSNRLRGKPDQNIYAIQLEPLIRVLESAHESKDFGQNNIHFPIPYSHVLVTHLLRNWKDANIRLAERHSSSESIAVCVGLTAVHDQLLGENTFESLLHKSPQKQLGEGNILENLNNDWQLEEQPVTQKSTTKNDDTPLTVGTINASNSGYCLIWDDNITDKVRVGELLGIREAQHDDWKIGIISWAQRHKDRIYTGVQLLSQTATAHAASTVLPDGNNSPYFRALLLTDSTQTESSSVITPSIPFEVDQTVRLQNYKEQVKAHLDSLVRCSATISQFTYQRLGLDSDANSN